MVEEPATREDLLEFLEEVKSFWKTSLALLLLLSRRRELREGPERKAKPSAADFIEIVTLPPKARAPQREAEGGAEERRKILIIDPDRIFAERLAEAFRGAGFEVLISADVLDGLIEVDEENPDLVLLSETLPGSEEACFRIHKLASVPVVILGSDPREDAWDRAVEVGAEAYLRKSLSPEELVARAQSILFRYGRSRRGGER